MQKFSSPSTKKKSLAKHYLSIATREVYNNVLKNLETILFHLIILFNLLLLHIKALSSIKINIHKAFNLRQSTIIINMIGSINTSLISTTIYISLNLNHKELNPFKKNIYIINAFNLDILSMSAN